MISNQNEDAVSPVMGTILMVAITVILAAVIAMYVFGAPANVTKTKVVVVTAQLENSGEIALMYQGGQDDETLVYITVNAPDANKYISSSASDGLTLCPSSDCGSIVHKKPIIGEVMKLPPSGIPAGQNHIAVMGTFGGGESQVILDTTV